MDETNIERIEWQATEYNHKERGADWFWTIGLVTLVVCITAIWFHNYVFALFVLISGGSLILFTLRHPQVMTFSIDKEGLSIGKDLHTWNKIKGFRVKDDGINPKLLVMTSRHFLPIYTIPLSLELVASIKEVLLRIIPEMQIEESGSMIFMEKLGF